MRVPRSRLRPAAPLAVVGAVLLLPALALFGLWRFAEGQTSEPTDSMPPTTLTPVAPLTPPGALATPLISFRRVPGLLARDLNDDTFRQQAQAFADTIDATSCLVVELDGVEVATHNPDLPVIPASNQKLLVAAAALKVLGADYTFTTEARASSVAGGVVAGDLYLVGSGDPLLTTNDYLDANITEHQVTSPTPLDSLADAIVAAGVTQIQGGVVGDGSRYDDEYYRPYWADDADVRVKEAGPYDALIVNDDRYFDGEWRVADDPNLGGARELTRLLGERGVTVGADASVGTAPAEATAVANVQSAPLPAVVGEMLGTSDNNTAELLVKEMGVATSGEGTTAAGVAAMTSALQQLGIDTTGLVIDDGSGLSNDNRVTCRQLVGVLDVHAPGDELAAGLPIAGQTGTLSDVFTDSPVAGRLVAKTGTLGNEPYNADPPAVKSLSGYLPVEGGGVIEFAFVMNSAGTLADQGVYRPIWDRFVQMLSAYPAGPSAAQLGPR